MLVVLDANAIVEPDAMMIKLIGASVTSTTMLGKLLHMSVAELAIQLVFILLKVVLVSYP